MSECPSIWLVSFGFSVNKPIHNTWVTTAKGVDELLFGEVFGDTLFCLGRALQARVFFEGAPFWVALQRNQKDNHFSEIQNFHIPKSTNIIISIQRHKSNHHTRHRVPDLWMDGDQGTAGCHWFYLGFRFGVTRFLTHSH